MVDSLIDSVTDSNDGLSPTVKKKGKKRVSTNMCVQLQTSWSREKGGIGVDEGIRERK